MIINGVFVSDDEIMSKKEKFLKKINNIYITEEQINILKNYDIDINNYHNMNSLIYDIEEYLNNAYIDCDDLEWVSESLSEYNYYNNINK